MLKKQKLRRSTSKKPLSARMKAKIAFESALAVKALEPVVLKLKDLVDYTDYFVITSGSSITQVSAIFENIMRSADIKGIRSFGVEGEKEARWIVIDWGDVIVHIFYHPLREFYELEKLWADAPRVNFERSSKNRSQEPKPDELV